MAAVTITVTGKHGPLEASLLARIQRDADRSLPFNHLPIERATWQSSSGRTAVFAWRPRDSWDAGKPLINATEAAAVALGGEPLGEGDVPRALLDAHATSPAAVRDLVLTLGGTFGVAHVDDRTDTTRHWNALTRLQPVYWAETDDLIVAGSRALLVHYIASGRDLPDYDPVGLGTLATVGWFCNELTPFKGVTALPANSELTITPSSVEVRMVDDTLMVAPPDSGPARPEDIDRATEAALAAVAPLKTATEPLRLGLTGGKDSRLVAAILSAAGVPFACYTGGRPGNPEGIVAERVAKALGVEHRLTNPQPETSIALGARIEESLFLRDGMMTTWRPTRRRRLNHSISLGGGGGEILRGGYLKGIINKKPLSAHTHVHFKHLFSRHDHLLTPGPAAAKAELLDAWVAERRRSMTFADILDRIYLEYRCGRWASCGHAERTLTKRRVVPLFDPRLIRAALQIGSLTRARDHLIEGMLSRLAPQLLEIPLATTRFRTDKRGIRRADRAAHKQRSPLAKEIDRRFTASSWRYEIGGRLAPFFVERIFEDRAAEPMWDVVDREEVERLFTSPDVYKANVLPIWRVVSIAALVSNRWLSKPREEVPIEIGDPMPWADLRMKILRELGRARNRVESVDGVLDSVAKRTAEVADDLGIPNEAADRHLETVDVRVNGTRVSLRSVLRDRDVREQLLKAARTAPSTNGHGVDGRRPRDARDERRIVLDAVAGSLLPKLPAHSN